MLGEASPPGGSGIVTSEPPQGLLHCSWQPFRLLLPISQVKKPRSGGVERLPSLHSREMLERGPRIPAFAIIRA